MTTVHAPSPVAATPSAATAVSLSAMGTLLRKVAAGSADKGEVKELAQDPTKLAGLTPHEAQKAIDVLAAGGTTHGEEQGIVNLLAALSPQDRGQALRLIDGGADKYTSRHLLNDDIDDAALRAVARALMHDARPYAHTTDRIVLSDIDDTVKPWKDESAKGKPVFPGARALYRALDEGQGNGTIGDVTFVSARDGIVVGAERDLNRTGIDYNSVAYGDSLTGLLSLFGANKGIEDHKVKNINAMLDRNPESKVVLVGDSTQADPDVFKRILASRADRVEYCLVHHVKGFPVADDVMQNPKFIVFDTYADAARMLHDRGVINDRQLDDVLNDR